MGMEVALKAEWTGSTRSGGREAEIECLARNIGRVVRRNDGSQMI